MCTLTFGIKRENIIVTFNRDERLKRKAEKPPFIQSHLHKIFYAPQDTEQGGTWIGINMTGHIACLTNYYAANHILEKAKSRGLIVPQLLSAEKPENFLHSLPLKGQYNGFTAFLCTNEIIYRYIWDGYKLHSETFNLRNEPFGWRLFSSSSYDEQNVLRLRQSAFEKWLNEGRNFISEGMLPSIHVHSFDKNPHANILMKREQAQTKSIFQIVKPLRQGGSAAMAHYWPTPHENINLFRSEPLHTSFLPERIASQA